MAALRPLLVVGCGVGGFLTVGAVSPVSVVPAVGSEVVALAMASGLPRRARRIVVRTRLGVSARRGVVLRGSELRPSLEGARGRGRRLLLLARGMGQPTVKGVRRIAAAPEPVHRQPRQMVRLETVGRRLARPKG